MKILFTSTGDDLNAVLDPRFGRAAKFLIYNLDNDSFEIFDNSVNIGAAHGAGIAAAEAVCNLGVEVVITGNCGPKAYAALSAAGVKVYTATPASIVSLLDAYKNGELDLAQTANVTGHWSGGVRAMNNTNNENDIPVNLGYPVCTGERLGRGWGGSGQGLGRGAAGFVRGGGAGRGAGCGRGRGRGLGGRGMGVGMDACRAGFVRGAGRGVGTGRGW